MHAEEANVGTPAPNKLTLWTSDASDEAIIRWTATRSKFANLALLASRQRVMGHGLAQMKMTDISDVWRRRFRLRLMRGDAHCLF